MASEAYTNSTVLLQKMKDSEKIIKKNNINLKFSCLVIKQNWSNLLQLWAGYYRTK